jgi:hypothetical protein
VPPFGAAAGNPLPGGLPVVVIPFNGIPVFDSGFIASAPDLPDPARAQVAWPRNVPGGGVSDDVQPSRLLTACHSVPNGYHCDWPS